MVTKKNCFESFLLGMKYMWVSGWVIWLGLYHHLRFWVNVGSWCMLEGSVLDAEA